MSSGNISPSPVIPPASTRLNEKDTIVLKRLIYNYFVKAASIVINTRLTSLDSALQDNHKVNNWFNLSIDISNIPKDQFKPWKSQDIAAIPPLVIETFLDLRDIHPKQKLYLNDSENNPWFVTKGKRKTEVVLERWLFELNRAFLEQQEENGNDIQEEEEVEEEEDNNNNNNHRHHPDHHHHNDNNNYSSSNDPTSDEPLPAIYKKCIVLFRDLFTYINLLPATKLRKTIDNYNIDDHGSKVSYQNLRIGIRILKGNQPISSKGRIGLSKELISTYTNISNESDDLRPHLSDEKFKSIDTPFGSFKVSVQYRKDTNFYLNKKVSEVENTAGSPNIAEVDENQNKRVSLLSNQSGSPQQH